MELNLAQFSTNACGLSRRIHSILLGYEALKFLSVSVYEATRYLRFASAICI